MTADAASGTGTLVERPRARIETAERALAPEGRADPCVMVIFGASGDLTRRQLLPSLFELHCKGLLPEPFAVVGTARSDWDSDRFRDLAREAAREECRWTTEAWERFAPRLRYVRTDAAGSDEEYARLGRAIEEAREAASIPDHVFFHLAVPPRFFGTIARRLGAAGLSRSEGGWRRLVIEKPFGEDLASARELDRELREAFGEDQIYRIDHFLGKETVQNMVVFRLANPGWEPIWNRNYIDHVQITAAESVGVGARAGFYEGTGVIRDMVQNHLLQLLCTVAMEPPLRYDARSLRDESVKVLQAVNLSPADDRTDVVLGQYGPGAVGGERVPGYREEEGVDPGSTTPTFCALRLTLDNWRWAGVPVYLRTGKRLGRKLTEVAIRFRPTPHVMFPTRGSEPSRDNVLAFRLQPDEGIVRTFLAKRPGPGIALQTVTMNFGYADAFGIEEPPRAYAWLLLDVMQGDQTLFARADWVYEAWRTVDPIVARSEAEPPGDFPNYAAGTAGPAAAAGLLEREGREWREL